MLGSRTAAPADPSFLKRCHPFPAPPEQSQPAKLAHPSCYFEVLSLAPSYGNVPREGNAGVASLRVPADTGEWENSSKTRCTSQPERSCRVLGELQGSGIISICRRLRFPWGEGVLQGLGLRKSRHREGSCVPTPHTVRDPHHARYTKSSMAKPKHPRKSSSSSGKGQLNPSVAAPGTFRGPGALAQHQKCLCASHPRDDEKPPPCSSAPHFCQREISSISQPR